MSFLLRRWRQRQHRADDITWPKSFTVCSSQPHMLVNLSAHCSQTACHALGARHTPSSLVLCIHGLQTPPSTHTQAFADVSRPWSHSKPEHSFFCFFLYRPHTHCKAKILYKHYWFIAWKWHSPHLTCSHRTPESQYTDKTKTKNNRDVEEIDVHFCCL